MSVLVPQNRRHRLLEDDGLCSAGRIVSPGDTFINKEVPTNTRDTYASLPGPSPIAYKASPMSYKGSEGELVIVDKVLIANNDEGSTVVKVGLQLLCAQPCRHSGRGDAELNGCHANRDVSS